MQLWLPLLNISNPILTSTRSHPFHFKARDWEPIYSTKRRLNIDYWGSSDIRADADPSLPPPRPVTQFTLFFLSPIPNILRAICPRATRFCEARISSNLSTCTVHVSMKLTTYYYIESKFQYSTNRLTRSLRRQQREQLHANLWNTSPKTRGWLKNAFFNFSCLATKIPYSKA